MGFRSCVVSLLYGIEAVTGAGCSVRPERVLAEQPSDPVYNMSYLEQGPPKGKAPQSNGPVLVMPPARQRTAKWELWRRRIFLIIFVLFCLEIGIILTVAPWTPFWTSNSLIAGYPKLRELLGYGFVRGLVSGLGIADIWLAVAEAVRYREPAD